MRQATVFALGCSCVAHLVFIWAISAIPKGAGGSNPLASQSQMLLVNVSSWNVEPSFSSGQTPKPIAGSVNASTTINPAVAVSAALFLPKHSLTLGQDVLQNPYSLPRETPKLLESYGLQGKSDITYWPFDAVDEPALLLAEWPEAMSSNAWPPDQPVVLELWVNPDGALADIAFPQKDLPDSLRITLTETIFSAGFKPAMKNGSPVGNYRVLEVLLSRTSVPPLVIY